MGDISSATGKKIKVVMTGSAPVMVDIDVWPYIAGADGTSYRGLGQDCNPEQSDTYRVRVRQHADGRALVYARLVSGWNRAAGDTAAGQRVPAGGSIPDAIWAVVDATELPDSMATDCIADLPPTELV